MQGQLLVTEKDFCDFVVWTPHGIKIQRIYQNIHFTEKLVRKLTNFYVEHVLPEILQRSMQSLQSECAATNELSNENSEPIVYCLCQQEEHGKMIMCEDPNCEYVWFHFKCVGIKRASKQTWFCPICAVNHNQQ